MPRYQVRVTNRNDFAIEERYDGVPYVIPAKGKIDLPYEAAAHIFGAEFASDDHGASPAGLRERIYQHVQRRWGWNRAIGDAVSRDYFNNLEFRLMAMTVTLHDAAEDAPLRRPRDKAALRADAPDTAAAPASGEDAQRARS